MMAKSMDDVNGIPPDPLRDADLDGEIGNHAILVFQPYLLVLFQFPQFGNLRIDPERRTAAVEGKPVALRLKEFDLLLTLAQNRGIVFSREKLLDVVWGFDFAGETRTVDVHVAHLRHKLAGMQPTLETVWGVGYKLE